MEDDSRTEPCSSVLFSLLKLQHMFFKTNLTAYLSSFEAYPASCPCSSLASLLSDTEHVTTSFLSCFSCVWLSAAPGYDEPPRMPASNFKGFLECQYHLGCFYPEMYCPQKGSCELEGTRWHFQNGLCSIGSQVPVNTNKEGCQSLTCNLKSLPVISKKWRQMMKHQYARICISVLLSKPENYGFM